MSKRTIVGVLWCVSVLGLGGCGSGVQQMGGQQPALRPGIYTGTLNCQGVLSSGGFSLPFGGPSVLTVTIGNAGRPVIEGQEVAAGLTIADAFGPAAGTTTITSVTESDNGVTVNGRFNMSSCANTCVFSFDLICDEILDCALGTDCNDCGPAVLRGATTDSYQRSGADRIRLTTTSAFADPDGLFVLNGQCDGVLSR